MYDAVHPVSPVGVLLKTLICMDIDSHALYEYLIREHPEWFAAPHAKAKTSQGYHLLWLRTSYCDELNITDKARMLSPVCVPEKFLDVNGQVPIDVKTIATTGTGGVLVVAPNPDKEWLTPPWALQSAEGPVLSGSGLSSMVSGPSPVPDALIDLLDANKKRRTGRRPQAGLYFKGESASDDVSNPNFDRTHLGPSP